VYNVPKTKGVKGGDLNVVRTNITLTERAYQAAGDLPRRVPLSAIARWILLACVTPEKELRRMRDASPEGTAVADYLRGKIEKLVRL
jgi:hypothetical protein